MIAIFVAQFLSTKSSNQSKNNFSSNLSQVKAQEQGYEPCTWNPSTNSQNPLTCEINTNAKSVDPACVNSAVWADYPYSLIGAYQDINRTPPNQYCNILNANEGQFCDFSRGQNATGPIAGKCTAKATCQLDCHLCEGEKACLSPEAAQNDPVIREEVEKKIQEMMTIKLKSLNMYNLGQVFRNIGIGMDIKSTMVFMVEKDIDEGCNTFVKTVQNAMREGSLSPEESEALILYALWEGNQGWNEVKSYMTENWKIDSNKVETIFNYLFGFIEIKYFALQNLEDTGTDMWTYPVYFCSGDEGDPKPYFMMHFTGEKITGILFGYSETFNNLNALPSSSKMFKIPDACKSF